MAHDDDTARREKIRLAYERGEAKPALESRGAANRILTGAQFIADHVPPVWLIDGIVQRGRLYACTSLTGHGKTAIWLFNACMVHAGRPIGHLDTFQGNVLILAGENPADLEARMIGMAKAYKIPVSQLPYVLPGSFPMTAEQADALKEAIARIGVRSPSSSVIRRPRSFPATMKTPTCRPVNTPEPCERSPMNAPGIPPSLSSPTLSRAPPEAICCHAAAAPF